MLSYPKEPMKGRGKRYPILVSLEGRQCLVVGGGSVGERKIRGLLEFGASIKVVARELTPWLESMREKGLLTYLGSEYCEGHMEEADLVFAVTSDALLNRRIAEDAHKRKKWCNTATDPECSSFIVPSTVQRGSLTIAVSTEGRSPAVARLIRERLEGQFGPEWVLYLELLGRLRVAIQGKGLETAANQELFRNISLLPILEWIVNHGKEEAVNAVAEVCRAVLNRDEIVHIWDEAWKSYSS